MKAGHTLKLQDDIGLSFTSIDGYCTVVRDSNNFCLSGQCVGERIIRPSQIEGIVVCLLCLNVMAFWLFRGEKSALHLVAGVTRRLGWGA